QDLEDDFFIKTSYVGAFGGNNWMLGWTALSNLGYTEMVTDVEETYTSSTPDLYNLSQNYPNPFNPSTIIEFSLPKENYVKLSVFNILGQEVATLINGQRNAGVHSVSWNADNLTSGVYIYRLEAGANTITRKMTLLK
ncbi:MAG: T9SS type A sorting domain-containing protein, partial [Melioribacteraceae bacterium]|nr:T9SS type A sorting domain-containing protein [Melioribacteraceae bacterium]